MNKRQSRSSRAPHLACTPAIMPRCGKWAPRVTPGPQREALGEPSVRGVRKLSPEGQIEVIQAEVIQAYQRFKSKRAFEDSWTYTEYNDGAG